MAKKVGQTHTPRAPRKRKNSAVSDLSGMNKPQEYLEFIIFMSLPRALREQLTGAETQDDFSEKYGINRNTLVSWKKRAGFWEDVQNARKSFFRERSGDVLLALENTCLKEGKGSDVKVYLTYTDEYTDKAETEHKISPELQSALEKIEKIIP